MISNIIVAAGHIGITVPDVDEACKRFEHLNVEFIKKPNDGKNHFIKFAFFCELFVVGSLLFFLSETGKMKGLAFIKDPDGYWIEILAARKMAQLIL